MPDDRPNLRVRLDCPSGEGPIPRHGVAPAMLKLCIVGATPEWAMTQLRRVDSDGSSGLAAWPGRSVPAVHEPTGRGRPPDSGWPAGREPVGVGVKRRRQAGGLGRLGSAWSAWCRVRGGRREGDGGPPGPEATVLYSSQTHATFGPGARRVPRRAPLQSDPPGGLFRPLNTWPTDRYAFGGGRPLRSAVIARDSPVRWLAVIRTRPPSAAPGTAPAALCSSIQDDCSTVT